MTDQEQQFRELYPNIDTLIEHSPLRARFLLLSWLYYTSQKENTPVSKP